MASLCDFTTANTPTIPNIKLVDQMLACVAFAILRFFELLTAIDDETDAEDVPVTRKIKVPTFINAYADIIITGCQLKFVLEFPSLHDTPPSAETHKLTKIIATGDSRSEIMVEIDCAFWRVSDVEDGPPRASPPEELVAPYPLSSAVALLANHSGVASADSDMGSILGLWMVIIKVFQ